MRKFLQCIKSFSAKDILGFACYKLVFDDFNEATDLKFIEVSNSFLTITGLTMNHITGKTVKQSVPEIKSNQNYWEIFYDTELSGIRNPYMSYFTKLNRKINILTLSPAKHILIDILFQNKPANVSDGPFKSYGKYIIKNRKPKDNQLKDKQSSIDLNPYPTVEIEVDEKLVMFNQPAADLYKSRKIDKGGILLPTNYESIFKVLLEFNKSDFIWRDNSAHRYFEKNIRFSDDGKSIKILIRDITEQKLKEYDQHKNTGLFKEAKAMAKIGNFRYNIRSGKVIWSDELYEIFGRDKNSLPLTYSNIVKMYTPESLELHKNVSLRSVQNGGAYNVEYEIVRENDKKHAWINIIGKRKYEKNTGYYIEGIIQDITDRKKYEKELRSINRALSTISECNKIEVRAKSEKELLSEICSVIIKESGYKMAWVGYAENSAGKPVIPVASAGYEKGYLENARISWEDNKLGRGPTGTSIRTGKTTICQNMQNDPNFKPWRKEALKRGYHSSIVLPLVRENKVFGALSIYSTEPNAFDEKEVKLLEELSENISYSIFSIRNKEEKKLADERAEEAEKKYRIIFENSEEGLLLTSPDGRILDANPAATRILGYSREEIIKIGRNGVLDTNDPRLPEYLEKRMKDGYATGELRFRHKSGKLIEGEVTSRIFGNEEGELFTSMIIRDISERKMMQEQLVNKEKELRTLFEILPVAVSVIDENRKMVKANPAFGRILDIPPDKINDAAFLKRKYMDVNLKELNHSDFPSAIALKEQRNVLDKEIGIMKEDGNIIWTNVSAAPLGNGSAVIVTSDISERFEAMQKLNRLNIEILDLYNNAPCGYHSLDIDGNIIRINDTELKWLGYKRDEVLGRLNITSILTPESRDKFRNNYPGFLKTGHTDDLEMDFIRKDGSVFSANVNSTAVYDKNGNYNHCRTTIFDITARKEAERKLEASSKNWSDTFNAINDYIWMLDKNGTIIQSNKRTSEFFCSDCGPDVGRKCFEIMHGTDCRITNCPFTAMNISKKREIRELIRNDRTFSITVDPIFNEKNEYSGAVHIISDITELKEAENKMRDFANHVQKAREDERTEISKILHDNFGQSLTGLKMEIASLEKKLQRLIAENEFDEIARKIKSMKTVLDDSVELTGKIAMELRPNILDTLGLIPAIDWLAKDYSEKSGIHFTFECSNGNIKIDPKTSTEVFRILQEGLTNVVRHSDATKTEIILNADSDSVLICVSDNGRGIKEKEIMSPYSLGILNMRERSSQFGGEIILTGIPGKGTELKIKIPNTELC